MPTQHPLSIGHTPHLDYTPTAASDIRQRSTMPEMIHSLSSGTMSPSESYDPESPYSLEKASPWPSNQVLLSSSDHAQEPSAHGGQKGGSSYFREFAKGALKKSIRQDSFVSKPVKGTEEVWIEAEQEAVEWMSLFYDLVVVAVLTMFSTQHELATPAVIPVFLSFFVIIFWLWVSQTTYDMRYQGNDALNRFFKFIQVGLFIYQGAAGGNWNPGKIDSFDDSADPYGSRTSQHKAALQSFVTVAIAFAVSRAVLAVQYGICMIQGRKAGRQVTHLGINILALLASMTLAIASCAVPSTSPTWKIAKIVLFYSGVLVEVVNVFVGVLLRVQPPIETHKIAERHGAFTLIVLGEGFISVTKAFSKAISGLSDDDSGTYVQVFLTILIIFLIYSFLFGTFDKNDHTGHGRAIVWQMVHFPLCFGILLLVAAMTNVVITLSSAHGLSLILDLFKPFSFAVFGLGSTYLDPANLKQASKYMNKLSLEPPFAQAITDIYSMLNETAPALDPQVVYLQYAAQICYTAYQKYGLDIPIEATTTYNALYSLNTTWMEDASERLHIRAEAGQMLTEIVQEILNDSFTGVLWLLPVAGCVLILTALRSMIWYRFSGAAHWIYHGPQIVAGVCLGLLGLLDIGPRHIDIAQLDNDGGKGVNPLYQVLLKEIPLVIIAAVYFVVYIGSGAVIWYIQRRKDQRNRLAGATGQPGMLEQGEKGLGMDGEPTP